MITPFMDANGLQRQNMVNGRFDQCIDGELSGGCRGGESTLLRRGQIDEQRGLVLGCGQFSAMGGPMVRFTQVVQSVDVVPVTGIIAAVVVHLGGSAAQGHAAFLTRIIGAFCHMAADIFGWRENMLHILILDISERSDFAVGLPL